MFCQVALARIWLLEAHDGKKCLTCGIASSGFFGADLVSCGRNGCLLDLAFLHAVFSIAVRPPRIDHAEFRPSINRGTNELERRYFETNPNVWGHSVAWRNGGRTHHSGPGNPERRNEGSPSSTPGEIEHPS